MDVKKSWGIYVFHYLPLACAAYYLRSFTSELPEGIVYIVAGISAFAGALLLYEIIRRIPIICWCVLGLKKEKKMFKDNLVSLRKMHGFSRMSWPKRLV